MRIFSYRNKRTLRRIALIALLAVVLLGLLILARISYLGLSVGADDYITKPFNPVEVLARVKSQLRRFLQLGAAVKAPSELTVGGIALDHDAKRVTLDGEEIALTPKEYDILYYLMQHPGKVFTPAELYSAVWNEAPVAIDNTVAVHIRHLREKLEINPSEPRYLKVVWGKGYKLEGDRS